MSSAVEHVVGGNLDDESAPLVHGMGQKGRRFSIEPLGQCFVRFGFVNGGVGSTVDDAVNLVLINKTLDIGLRGDVELCHIGIEPLMLTVLWLERAQAGAQLPVAASDENVHSSSSPCLSF